MNPVDVSGQIVVGLFSFGGMLAVFTFLWRVQKGTVYLSQTQAAAAAQRAAHAEQRVDAMQDQIDVLREQLGLCRAETSQLKRALAEYVENGGS